MKNFKLVAALSVLACATTVFSSEDAMQVDSDAKFKVYTLLARKRRIYTFVKYEGPTCVRATSDPSHKIMITKTDKQGNKSHTLITPQHLNGIACNSSGTPINKNDGACSMQNPATDPDARFINGTFDKGDLAIQLAVHEECKGDVYNWKYPSSIGMTCPNATFILHGLKRESMRQLKK